MLVEACLMLAALLVFLILRDRKPSSMPPGPFEVPFLGQRPDEDADYLMKMKAKYGDIVTFRTGACRTVYIYDYKTAKDVMGRQEFGDRPAYTREMMADEKKSGGVSMSSGTQWMHDRRFMIRNLRNFGMGKSYLEDAMNLEGQNLVQDLKKYAGEAINFPNSLRTAPLNVIWQMMAGKRYDLRSKEVEVIFVATQELLANSSHMMMEVYFPIIKYLPTFIKEMFFIPDLMQKFSQSLVETVDQTITEHEKSFNPDNIRDLVDEYLLDWKTAEKKGESHLFRRGALCQIIADGFDAGSDTIHYAIRWVLFLLARHPDVAAKLQKSLDDVFPRDKFVSLQDKLDLPLIESFVTEMFRYSSFPTVTFERCANKNTNVNGFFLPKDTIIKAVSYAIHNDPKLFDAPEEFRPFRFIDEEGKFHAPKEGFFTFSAGRRSCPGETLARAEVFLFTIAILQNFHIQLPKGATFVDKYQNGAFGFRAPHDQKLIYKSRD